MLKPSPPDSSGGAEHNPKNQNQASTEDLIFNFRRGSMSELAQTPERVLVFDTTLRDGAQPPGIAFSVNESLQIAKKLSDLGVDVIEAGFPVSSPENFDSVRKIGQEVEGPVIAGLARAVPGDIEAAAKALKDCQNPRIHTFVSTSDIHIQSQMENTREDVLGMTKAAVSQAKGFVDDVEFSPMDATRSDVEFTAEVIQTAIDEGATTINIPDTVGYTQMYEYAAFIERLYELTPALGGVVVSVHCHDDLGLAVANSFAGIRAGARQVECSINGLGERAGNAALEEIVMLLRTRRNIDGFDTAINTELLVPTSALVERLSGYALQRHKAVVGDNAFRHASGIHQDGVLTDPNTFEIMRPQDVGRDLGEDNIEGIVLTKQSGSRAFVDALQRAGVYDAKYRKSSFKLFKELADKVKTVTTEQAAEIHLEDQRRQSHGYKINRIDVSGERHVAFIIYERNGKEQQAITPHQYDPDGPTSSIFMALGAATETDYKLVRFKVESIGEGAETIGKARVEIRINGKTVTGEGLSLDSHKASALAYLDAIAKAEAIEASASTETA